MPAIQLESEATMRAATMLAVLLVAVGCNVKPGGPPRPGSAQKPSATKSVATIECGDLWSDYDANTVKADADYKGKTITVSGDAIEIASEAGGYVIYLEAVAAQKSIRCFLATDASKSAANLKTGQRVSVLGQCAGRERQSGVFKDFIVILKDCRVVSTLPLKPRHPGG